MNDRGWRWTGSSRVYSLWSNGNSLRREMYFIVGPRAYTEIKIWTSRSLRRQPEERRWEFLPQRFSSGLSFCICKGKIKWSMGSLPILISYKSSYTHRPNSGARETRALSNQRCVLFPVMHSIHLMYFTSDIIVSLCLIFLFFHILIQSLRFTYFL